MKIKKGDHVVVVAGRDRGRTGLVIAAYPDRGKVLVQGVNVVKKNKKVTYQGQRGAKEGGITHEEAPIDVSNVQLADPDSKNAARDHDHVIVLLDLHHSTSGASEMIRMNRFSRSSRPTGPKMRVPRGSPPSRISTAAFSSNRM